MQLKPADYDFQTMSLQIMNDIQYPYRTKRNRLFTSFKLLHTFRSFYLKRLSNYVERQIKLIKSVREEYQVWEVHQGCGKNITIYPLSLNVKAVGKNSRFTEGHMHWKCCEENQD